MTDFIKTKDIKNSWLLIDATDAIVGRLAVFISKKNVEKIKFTGNKFKNKKYFKHTGHPGGIKETTPEKLSSKKPGEILKLAVKRMLPGGPLAKKQMSKLKIYSGDKHPHESQNPKEIFLNQMNKKNLLRRQ